MRVPTINGMLQPHQTFESKKAAILSGLSVPVESYYDLSPKGSIDAAIRQLIDEINTISGYVTTSSCSGRVVVFLEGIGKRALRDESDLPDEEDGQEHDGPDRDQHDDAAQSLESPSKRARTALASLPLVAPRPTTLVNPDAPLALRPLKGLVGCCTAFGRDFAGRLKHSLARTQYPEEWAAVLLREHRLLLVQEQLEIMTSKAEANQQTKEKLVSLQELKRITCELYTLLISKAHGRDVSGSPRISPAPFLFPGGTPSLAHQVSDAPGALEAAAASAAPPPGAPGSWARPAPAPAPVPTVVLPPLRSPLRSLLTPAITFAPSLIDNPFSESLLHDARVSGRTDDGAKSFRQMASSAPVAAESYLYYPRADGCVIRRRIAPPVLFENVDPRLQNLQLAILEDEHLKNLTFAHMSETAQSASRDFSEADVVELRGLLDEALPRLAEFFDERQMARMRVIMGESLQRLYCTADMLAAKQPPPDEKTAKRTTTLAGTGGKGGGGHWLFASHESLTSLDIEKQLVQLTQDWVDARLYNGKSGVRRHIHFKFEPFILHVLTASPAHAQLLIRHALAAGFRETGAVNLTVDGELPAHPVVAIRTAGLAFGTLLGFQDDNGARYSLASPAALESMAGIAEQRIRENANRLQRFRKGFLDGVAATMSGGRPEWWEDAQTRRIRKREEGLRRARELRDGVSRDGEL